VSRAVTNKARRIMTEARWLRSYWCPVFSLLPMAR
jgi:hypothetical protein